MELSEATSQANDAYTFLFWLAWRVARAGRRSHGDATVPWNLRFQFILDIQNGEKLKMNEAPVEWIDFHGIFQSWFNDGSGNTHIIQHPIAPP